MRECRLNSGERNAVPDHEQNVVQPTESDTGDHKEPFLLLASVILSAQDIGTKLTNEIHSAENFEIQLSRCN